MRPRPETPLLDAMASYAADTRLSLHTPGHGQGKGLPTALARRFATYGLGLDLTELPGLDNLAAPFESIKNSQDNLAALADVPQAYYLVNGSTGGLEAAMLAMGSPEAPTILPAHSHTAIQQGLILTGSMPVILPSRIDPDWGLPLGLDRAVAETLLVGEGRDMHAALWITTHPTYHGVFADLPWEKTILDSRADWGWLVDEAHGAHLPYSNIPNGSDIGYPENGRSAISYGAHVVVQSVHKMGIGFTQSGVLFCCRDALADRIRQAVNITQSTSPSYLLLASLDMWQAFLQEEGPHALALARSLAREIADGIRRLDGYRLWQDDLPDGYNVDPRKITISAEDLSIDGYTLASQLKDNYQIDVEMATATSVLFIIHISHDHADADRLLTALASIRDAYHANEWSQEKKAARKGGRINHKLADMYDVAKPICPAISPREAFFRPRQRLQPAQAIGRLAASAVTPYPPGIPLVFPGMVITEDVADKIEQCRKTGLACAGAIPQKDSWYIEVVSE